MGAIASETVPTPHDHDADYDSLRTLVSERFDRIVQTGITLFATATEDLYSIYLDALTAERQIHTCHECRRFIQTYGGLVTIAEDGSTDSVMWGIEGVPEFYVPVVQALRRAVLKARVTGVFISSEKTWGVPKTGNWTHFSVTPPQWMVYQKLGRTPDQAMAEAKEDFRTVARALNEFHPKTISEALRLVQTEVLRQSEKFVGPLVWLRDLHENRNKAKRNYGPENVLWRAIATAPTGFCHPRASVVGSLLEDIEAGHSFEGVKGRFNTKLNPFIYGRPQAAPTVGNIARAEEIVAELGIGPSLERRFARLDEVSTIWKPITTKSKQTSGIFGHLTPKQDANTSSPHLSVPAITMTWEKFARVVLPSAEQIEFWVPSGKSNYIALTTAAHENAPPILKWDREDERNPVSWYVYPTGSEASQWGLVARKWHKVTGIAHLPTMWGTQPMPYEGDGVILILEGAVDSKSDAGNALFPNQLKSHLHEIRSTLEKYSQTAILGGRKDASACGYDIRKTSDIWKANRCVRVITSGRSTEYYIDRWD